MKKLFLVAAATAVLAGCSGSSGKAQTAAPGDPVPVGPPNASNQKPAFAGQTRAPQVASQVAYRLTTVAEVEQPWGLAFLPDGALLITEKAGRLRILAGGKLSPPVAGLPGVDARGQGGLLGLAVDPRFSETGLIYFGFSEADPAGGNHTAVGRGKLDVSGGRLSEVKVVWRQTPSLDSDKHYGGRLVFARDGSLFVTTGDRSITKGRMQAQRMDGALGKVVRIQADGAIPQDNPFVRKARPEIWSIGHRNIQSAALNPRTGELWTVEHGARGGDELNIPRKGKDYGWPTIAYGTEYAGGPITGGLTQKAGMEQPVYYWDPVIAPSGMAFYDGALFLAWKGSLFVGGLKTKDLVRLVLDGDKVVGEERLLTDLGERIRDVVVGPDGALYLATDSANGKVVKLTPR